MDIDLFANLYINMSYATNNTIRNMFFFQLSKAIKLLAGNA